MAFVKIFDEPIRTTGYLEDICMDSFFALEYGELDFEGYVIIKQKYDSEDEYEYFFTRFDYTCGISHWETDWYEGQQEVWLLGYFESPSHWFMSDFDILLNFLKEKSNEND